MQKPMSERTKDQTEDEIIGNWVDSLKVLTDKIDEQDLGNWVARSLVLTDDIFHERDGILNVIPQKNLNSDGASELRATVRPAKRIHHWSDCEMHEELLMRKKGQHLSEVASEYFMKILSDNPNNF